MRRSRGTDILDMNNEKGGDTMNTPDTRLEELLEGLFSDDDEQDVFVVKKPHPAKFGRNSCCTYNYLAQG